MSQSSDETRTILVARDNQDGMIDAAVRGYQVTEARNMNISLTEEITPRVYQYIQERRGTPQEAFTVEQCIALIEHYLESIAHARATPGHKTIASLGYESRTSSSSVVGSRLPPNPDWSSSAPRANYGQASFAPPGYSPG